MATTYNLTLVRRNSMKIKVTAKKLVDGVETIIDLTGLTGSNIVYVVAKHPDAPDLVSLSIGLGITIVDAANGRYDIDLTTTHTDLPPEDYYHESTVVQGGQTMTDMIGLLTILKRLG